MASVVINVRRQFRNTLRDAIDRIFMDILEGFTLLYIRLFALQVR